MATFNDHYLQWRNRTRRYSRRSLLAATQRTLDAAATPGVEGLRRMPWLSLLAVKWICQDRMLDHGVGDAISQREYDDLLNHLWNIPVHEGRGDTSIYLRMRQLLRAQVGFQRGFTIGHFREAAFIERLPATDPLRQLFVQRAGLSPAALLDLSYCIFGVLVSGERATSIAALEPLHALHDESTIRSFFSLVSRDERQLLEFCRSLPSATHKKTSEYFEFPALSRYPFRRDGDLIRCWHPMLVYRCIEGLVHSVMSEAGQAYMDRFSKLFEAHVVSEARSLGLSCYDDTALRSWLGHGAKVPEILIECPGCNVFVEAKAGMFDESVMTAGSADILPSKLRAIRQAMKQGWSAALGVRYASNAPSAVKVSSNYLLVVTNKNLGASHGTRLAEMAADGVFAPDDPRALDALPIDHIYILSIDDFERLASAVRASQVQLPSLLAACVKDDSDASTSRFFFDQHLDHYKIPHSFSRLVTDAYEASAMRVAEQLGD